jgi:hypothetical protein
VPSYALAEFEQPFGCFGWNLPSLRDFVYRENANPSKTVFKQYGGIGPRNGRRSKNL